MDSYSGIEFGKRLRAARAYMGADQKTMARLIARSHNHIRAAENGEEAMQEGHIYMIAKAAGLPMEFFTAPWSRLGEATKYERAIEYVLSSRGEASAEPPPGDPAAEIEPPFPIPPLPADERPSPASTPATGRPRGASARGRSRPQ